MDLSVTDIVSIAGGMAGGFYAYEKAWDPMIEDFDKFMSDADNADSKLEEFRLRTTAVGSVTTAIAKSVGVQVGTTIALKLIFDGLKEIF